VKPSEPNMLDYRKEREGFSLSTPKTFSFPLDVFDGWKERLALFWTDGVREIKLTYRDFTVISSRGAGFLRKNGIKRGDPVLVMLPAMPQWWEVMLAVMRVGAVAVPATAMLTSRDMGERLKALKISAIISSEEDAPRVEEALKNIPYAPLLIIIGKREGWLSYERERDRSEPYRGERLPCDDPALIYFTSGTTGLPKMALHTQTSYPLAHLITGKYWLDLRPGDLHWNLSDTGWAKAAWSSFFGPWHMGATVFSYYGKGRFDAATTVEVLGRYPVTTFCGPPTAYRMMVKELKAFVFKSARHFVAAGEPLNKEIVEEWKRRTGLFIYDGYGQTETVNVIANFRCLPVKPGSMGAPSPGFTVDVVDENGTAQKPGVEGDIAIGLKPRPAGLFKEYLNAPQETEKTIRGDWYITGDRAYRDGDGYFWFVGRADDVILASGYRIGPFEIESVLIEHPAVKEAAVVASPDEVRGEVVKAFVVLTKDYAPAPALVAELQEFVKARTAPYKYPRKIEFVSELPKTVSGKIKRKELKRREFER
jgi:acetyl-CoA synthetase/medium-chain acyl-CoA synthetase